MQIFSRASLAARKKHGGGHGCTVTAEGKGVGMLLVGTANRASPEFPTKEKQIHVWTRTAVPAGQ